MKKVIYIVVVLIILAGLAFLFKNNKPETSVAETVVVEETVVGVDEAGDVIVEDDVVVVDAEPTEDAADAQEVVEENPEATADEDETVVEE